MSSLSLVTRYLSECASCIACLACQILKHILRSSSDLACDCMYFRAGFSEPAISVPSQAVTVDLQPEVHFQYRATINKLSSFSSSFTFTQKVLTFRISIARPSRNSHRLP